jgi:hypothetical protein
MGNRRNFLRSAGAAVLGGLTLPHVARGDAYWGAAAARPVGIQLYILVWDNE